MYFLLPSSGLLIIGELEVLKDMRMRIEKVLLMSVRTFKHSKQRRYDIRIEKYQ